MVRNENGKWKMQICKCRDKVEQKEFKLESMLPLQVLSAGATNCYCTTDHAACTTLTHKIY